MNEQTVPASLGYGALLNKTWPFILANMTVPLLSLTDTAVIGHYGDVAQMGALAIGGIIFNFLYWGFGFLRMGTSGLLAQALGANRIDSAHSIVLRSAVLASIIAGLIVLLQWPIYYLASQAVNAPLSVKEPMQAYFSIRIWGAPATLLLYVIAGLLIGKGDSRSLLYLQLALNGLNVVLDILFAGFLHAGVQGIAAGTVIAEYLIVSIAIVVLVKKSGYHLKEHKIILTELFLWQEFRKLILVNTDILLRTLALLFSFFWFTYVGAQMGESTLAANHILLQLISFCAFFLDGYAHVVEGLVGYAIGAKSSVYFKQSVKRTSVLALLTAFVLAAVLYLLGPYIIGSLTALSHVNAIAVDYLPFAIVYVVFAVLAFQLDGVFIGASFGRALRNSAFISSIVLFASWSVYFSGYGNIGLWGAFIIYVIARALALLCYYPALKQKLGPVNRS